MIMPCGLGKAMDVGAPGMKEPWSSRGQGAGLDPWMPEAKMTLMAGKAGGTAKGPRSAGCR